MREPIQPPIVETPVVATAAESALRKGLGLLDASMIVAGSMIGSGIFIVSAGIARQVDSPALLLIVWLASGLMTTAGALCYGELAAAMPLAGGEYIFLRESLGPIWGFLYGWATLLVIQTATIAAVAIAFANFTGVVWSWFSSSAWIWKLGTFGPYKIWSGALGPYNVGLNTQNLLAISSIVLLTWMNTRGLRVGARVQNIFTTVKIVALGGLTLLGFAFATQAARLANFNDFWRNVNFSGLHKYQAGENTLWVSVVTLVALAMVGALFSSSAWTNVTYIASEVRNPRRNLPLALILGTGIVTVLYVLANLAYLNVLPLAGTPDGVSVLARGLQFAPGDRVSDYRLKRRGIGGHRRDDFHIWLQQRTDSRRRARLLRDGQGRIVFQKCRQREPAQHPCCRPVGSVHLGVRSVPFRDVWTIARFSGFRGGHVLHTDDRRTLSFTLPPSEYGAALPGVRLPGASGDVPPACCLHRSAIVALQAALHLARPGNYFIWRAGLLAVAEVAERAIAKGP